MPLDASVIFVPVTWSYDYLISLNTHTWHSDYNNCGDSGLRAFRIKSKSMVNWELNQTVNLCINFSSHQLPAEL